MPVDKQQIIRQLISEAKPLPAVDPDWKRRYDAPEGQKWVCGACGREGQNSVDIGDESCFLNAVLVSADLVVVKAWDK